MLILIINAAIVTQNQNRDYIPRGFIIIKGNRIVKIGKGDPNPSYLIKTNKVIDAKKLIVFPGFINSHVHLGETAFKNLFRGKYSLEDYLSKTNEISGKTNLIEKNRRVIADYSLLQILKSGTTTLCGGRTADSSELWGIRNISGYMVMKSNKLKALSAGMRKKFIHEYKKLEKSNISHPAIFIHSINKIDLTTLPIIKTLLKKFPKTKLILHVAETKIQEKEVKKLCGSNSVPFLAKNGLLSENTILIHGNWLRNKDLALIKKYKSSIVQCLSSNINVSDKILDLSNVLNNKIRTCLATDGFPTSRTFSVVEESLKCFSFYQKIGKPITKEKCLDLVTIDAADVLGLKNTIGSIEENKLADLVFCKKPKNKGVDLTKAAKRVEGVIVGGNIKVWNRKLLNFNERSIAKKFNFLISKLKSYYEYLPNEK